MPCLTGDTKRNILLSLDHFVLTKQHEVCISHWVQYFMKDLLKTLIFKNSSF